MSFGINVIKRSGETKYHSNNGMTFGEWLETYVDENLDLDEIVGITVDDIGIKTEVKMDDKKPGVCKIPATINFENLLLNNIKPEVEFSDNDIYIYVGGITFKVIAKLDQFGNPYIKLEGV